MKSKETLTEKEDESRQATKLPGQNPKADDSPDKDEHHDENRRNLYEEPKETLKQPTGRKR